MILNILEEVDEDEINTKGEIEKIYEKIKETSDYFYNHNYEYIYTLCSLLETQVQFKLKYYMRARQFAITCRTNFLQNNIKYDQLLNIEKANKILEDCNNKIQKHFSNVIVFA